MPKNIKKMEAPWNFDINVGDNRKNRKMCNIFNTGDRRGKRMKIRDSWPYVLLT